jgi:hypothetical protein
MGEESIVTGYGHTTENQAITNPEGMDIEAMTNPNLWHKNEPWRKSFANYNHGN